jgi:hypothetical protein
MKSRLFDLIEDSRILARSFRTTLFRVPGVGGWTFARVPDRFAPPVAHGWGRTPVRIERGASVGISLRAC